MRDDLDQTMYFDKNATQQEMGPREVLRQVYTALEAKGYQPLNQLVGYILSGDPAYITSYNNARALIKKFDRDQYIEEMLINYLDER
ncbi:MAG: IreB family regulatory phosphoprotein [Peptococcaceae bacterium]|nr:IreB family regulatory phosphoprotein [Peptococcaceae bacterium]